MHSRINTSEKTFLPEQFKEPGDMEIVVYVSKPTWFSSNKSTPTVSTSSFYVKAFFWNSKAGDECYPLRSNILQSIIWDKQIRNFQNPEKNRLAINP